MDKNNKIKALITASTFPAHEGDTCPRFILDFCKGLEMTGEIECLVLAPHKKNSKNTETLEGIKVKRYRYFYPASFEKLSGNGIMPVITKNPFLIAAVPFFLLFQTVSTMITIQKYKPDVIIANWIIPQGLCAAVAKVFFPKTKLVIIARGGDVSLISKNGIFRLIGRLIFLKTDKLIAVSGSLICLLRKYFNINKKTPVIIPTGINENAFIAETAITTKKGNLLFVGRLVKKKGLHYLIQAMPEVIKKYPDIKLIIAGDGIIKQDLIKLTQELNINNSIIFIGAVKQSRLAELYLNSLLLIAPSIDTKNDIEGLPNVLKEAAAAKLPIITTDAGGNTDLITNYETGIIVEQHNSSQITEKILELLEDQTLRQNLAANAYNTVINNYTLEKTGEKYKNVIIELLSNSG